MGTTELVIYNNKYKELCKTILSVLNCSALWVMKVNDDTLSMLVTDHSILDHYWSRNYYLHDPNLHSSLKPEKSFWKARLGTDCETFMKSGFLYDLYKIFHVEEFVSIEKKIRKEHYCFRFFTRNNRFIFMNKLLNDRPLVDRFIDVMTKQCHTELKKQPVIRMTELNNISLTQGRNYANG